MKYCEKDLGSLLLQNLNMNTAVSKKSRSLICKISRFLLIGLHLSVRFELLINLSALYCSPVILLVKVLYVLNH